MNLQLRYISNKGDIHKERLTLRVLADLDVGDFVILQTAIGGDDVTTQVHHALWFPYRAVSKGDLIVVYTRRGEPSSKPLKERGIAHFFYWDLQHAIWAEEDRAAVLLHAPTWDFKKSGDLWR